MTSNITSTTAQPSPESAFHETTTRQLGAGNYGWRCSCAAAGSGFPSLARAETEAYQHLLSARRVPEPEPAPAPASVRVACGPAGCTVARLEHPLPAPPETAERLRRRRVRLGLSQKDVERRTGIDPRHLNEWEHGRGWPTPYEWGRLVRLYRELEPAPGPE